MQAVAVPCARRGWTRTCGGWAVVAAHGEPARAFCASRRVLPGGVDVALTARGAGRGGWGWAGVPVQVARGGAGEVVTTGGGTSGASASIATGGGGGGSGAGEGEDGECGQAF